jgi:ATP-dependent helicase/nuclease subunit B
VTELERYAGCPFAFFSARVLRLAEMEEVEEEISPLTRGRLLHAILHRFHKERLDVGAPPLGGGDAERARRDLHRIATEILGELPEGNLLWEATRAGLMAGCDPESGAGVRRSGALSAFLEVEIARGGEGWVPIALEWPFGMHEAPPAVLATPAGPVEVRGAIDRVDRNPDGACVVLDYKTGKRPPKPEIDAGVRFQLPLYVEAFRALGEHGSAERWNAAYYWVANHDQAGPKHELFGAGRGASGPELSALRHEVLERVGRIADAIAAGTFPLTVLPEGTAPCSTCPYRRVCRVDHATAERRRAALQARGGSVYLPGT